MAETKGRVLVVDDDEAVRSSIRLTLETLGYEVDEASDGEEGVSLQKSSPFDIAIIDMMMPNKDGLEMIRELKSMFPDLGILAMSGASIFAKINYLEAAKAFGASVTLKKPFEGDDLIAALNEIALVSVAGG